MSLTCAKRMPNSLKAVSGRVRSTRNIVRPKTFRPFADNPAGPDDLGPDGGLITVEGRMRPLDELHAQKKEASFVKLNPFLLKKSELIGHKNKYMFLVEITPWLSTIQPS